MESSLGKVEEVGLYQNITLLVKNLNFAIFEKKYKDFRNAWLLRILGTHFGQKIKLIG